MAKEKGNFLTRFLDKVDPLKLDDLATVEARRIMLGVERNGDGVSRKDIPRILQILSDKDGENLGVVERGPNEVSTRINGERVSVMGIDKKDGLLSVSFDGKEDVVHDPNLVGDILMRRMAERKRENLDNRK